MKNILAILLFVVCMTTGIKAADDCSACCGQKKALVRCDSELIDINLGRDIKKIFHPLNQIKGITKITVIGSFFKNAFKCEPCECTCVKSK